MESGSPPKVEARELNHKKHIGVRYEDSSFREND